jgi:hypothetical protein
VVHRLGAVAVRVQQESAVVVRAVLRPRPRLAVVAVAGGNARLPEGVDVLARGRAEAQVQPARNRLVVCRRRQREVAPLGQPLVRRRLLDAEQPQQLAVERLRRVAIRAADPDVIEQG